MRYAAFIITYKRTSILRETISALCNQTLPPEKILLIDNDPEQSAKQIISNDYAVSLSYYSAGMNSGPAGGAYWGLKRLFEEGWDWVLWVDDDDPPSAHNQLETICRLTEQASIAGKVGMVGAAGVLFDRSQWLIHRIPDSNLKGILEVDMIAGNQFPMVHRLVYEAGILPNPDLFFGFEDLDFGIRLRNAGFRILVDGCELKRLRHRFNKFGNEKSRGQQKSIKHLWREYYSIRTLNLMLNSRRYNIVWFRFLSRCLLKVVVGFRYGWTYGKMQTIFVMKGWWDGWKGNLGMRIQPVKK
jgi:GT2 family glycosyltransferase